LRGLRIVWRALRLILHILLGMILTPLVTQRNPRSGERRTNPYVTAWWHGRVLRILDMEVTTSGYRPQPPALIVSNHISWLDIILIGHLTPSCFLSKSEVRQWPLIGWLAARAGTLFIKRGAGQASAISQTIGDRLAQDGLLTLFPEGTTTDGRDVLPFFSRMFGAAIDTGSPIVPTSIRYHIQGAHDPIAPFIDDQSLGENMLGLFGRPRNQVHVHFGDPIHTKGLSRKALATAARKAIIDSLQASPPQAQATANSSAGRPF